MSMACSCGQRKPSGREAGGVEVGVHVTGLSAEIAGEP